MISFMVMWVHVYGDMEGVCVERCMGERCVGLYMGVCMFMCVFILKFNGQWKIIATLTISKITVNYCA